MIIIARILIALFLLAQSSDFAFAAEKKSFMNRLRGLMHRRDAPKPEDAKIPAVSIDKKIEPAAEKIDEMTKEELVKDVTENLKEEGALVNLIPGLKAEGDGGYTYNGTKLQDLDRKSLESIYGRTGTELARIRNERIQKQVERIQRLNALSARPAPPQPPRPVSAQSAPPRIPAPPPAPPQRRY